MGNTIRMEVSSEHTGERNGCLHRARLLSVTNPRQAEPRLRHAYGRRLGLQKPAYPWKSPHSFGWCCRNKRTLTPHPSQQNEYDACPRDKERGPGVSRFLQNPETPQKQMWLVIGGHGTHTCAGWVNATWLLPRVTTLVREQKGPWDNRASAQGLGLALRKWHWNVKY